MTQPRLYHWYEKEEAVSFFGAPNEAHSLCNGQWLIFPRTALCLTNIGEAPKMSHFHTGSHFYWVADQPYHVSTGCYSHFLPAQVTGAKGKERSIRLFVWHLEAQKYLYVGELEPSYMQQAPGGQNHGMARFELRPALSSKVWLQLGDLRLGNLDFIPVDRALARLQGQASLEDRLNALRQLVEYWHGPIGPEDGMGDAVLKGTPLPLPLLWWYRWAGNRSEIMTGQNIFFKPHDEKHKYWQLAIEENHLLFYIENQGVYEWSTLPEGEDPPVFGRFECKGPWEREDVTLSEHLILAALFEAVTCHAKYGASTAWLEEETVAEIAKTLPPVAIGPWRWCATKFYAGRGAFMHTAENGEYNGKKGYSVWIGAKTEQPLEFLKPYVDGNWEYVSF